MIEQTGRYTLQKGLKENTGRKDLPFQNFNYPTVCCSLSVVISGLPTPPKSTLNPKRIQNTRHNARGKMRGGKRETGDGIDGEEKKNAHAHTNTNTCT